MSSSPYSFAATFLTATLVFGMTSADVANPLFHLCFNPKIFTSGDRYEANLNKLIAYLYKNVPATGFGSHSIGKYPNHVTGLSLCRGDVSSSDCSTCIADAREEFPEICPTDLGAIVWYDNCLVKYDEAGFLGKIDQSNKFYMYNVNSVTDPAVFNKKTRELLKKLAKTAYVKPNLFAAGEGEAKGYTSPSKKKAVLYGMVQCTRDLSKSDCKKCLDDIIRELPSCCDGKEGGRVISGSCNFRYETVPRSTHCMIMNSSDHGKGLGGFGFLTGQVQSGMSLSLSNITGESSAADYQQDCGLSQVFLVGESPWESLLEGSCCPHARDKAKMRYNEKKKTRT